MITDANRSRKGSSKTGIVYCGWKSIRPTGLLQDQIELYPNDRRGREKVLGFCPGLFDGNGLSICFGLGKPEVIRLLLIFAFILDFLC